MYFLSLSLYSPLIVVQSKLTIVFIGIICTQKKKRGKKIHLHHNIILVYISQVGR